MNAKLNELVSHFNGYHNILTYELPQEEYLEKYLTNDIITRSIDTYFDRDTASRLSQEYWDNIDAIGYEWMTPRGKFTKRLLRTIPGLEPIIGYIGDAVTRRAYHLFKQTWNISLSDTIFWENGNFGKDSSCWWNHDWYPLSRYVWTKYNGIALLWHDTTRNAYDGIGRAWLMPMTDDEYGIDAIAICNQYGEIDDREILIDHTAQYISSLIPGTKPIQGQLHTNGTPYINEHTAIYIVDKSYNGSPYISPDWNHSGYQLCEDCDTAKPIDQLETHPDNSSKYLCNDCKEEHYFTCFQCGHTTHESDSQTDNDGNTYCSYCYNRKFVTCRRCYKTILKADALQWSYTYVCKECYAILHPQPVTNE